MPIVIKEIRVNTTVDQKVVVREDIPEALCARLREEILDELYADMRPWNFKRTKRER